MREVFGEYEYCVRVSYDFFDEMRSKGHEIGWHPHLWRWSGKEWIAELNDAEFVRNCLVNGFDCLGDVFEVTSVRTGWDFMSNETMRILESLGLRTDFSALPGIKYVEVARGIVCDWLGAPTDFYFPSRGDYRLPATSDRINVLEMPISLTVSPMLVRWVRPFVDWYRGVIRFPALYEALNLAKHPMFNKNGIDHIVAARRKGNPIGYLLTYFHPYEIGGSGLFSMQHLVDNINYLTSKCKEQAIELQTMTATEAATNYLQTRAT
jgi:hypothetical protein